MQLYKPQKDDTTGIYALAVPAKRKDIKVGLEMARYMDEHEEQWGEDYGMKAWAIAHAQLHNVEKPLAMFAVHPSLVDKRLQDKNARFPHRLILNPEILEAPEKLIRVKQYEKPVRRDGKRVIELHDQKHEVVNIHEPKEGCMSFPGRKPRCVKRFFEIKVTYQYPVKILGFWFLRRKTETIEALKAQIFQHECEHMEGKNIYFS